VCIRRWGLELQSPSGPEQHIHSKPKVLKTSGQRGDIPCPVDHFSPNLYRRNTGLRLLGHSTQRFCAATNEERSVRDEYAVLNKSPRKNLPPALYSEYSGWWSAATVGWGRRNRDYKVVSKLVWRVRTVFVVLRRPIAKQ
jgi:hypothetical protein